jgi:hypothetical protein
VKEETKGVKSAAFVQVDDGKNKTVFGLPPYMTAEQWSVLIGKTERAVKKDLQTGAIARYQPTKGGLVYVNVYQEIEKTKIAPAY